jgi:hypothetical protein
MFPYIQNSNFGEIARQFSSGFISFGMCWLADFGRFWGLDRKLSSWEAVSWWFGQLKKR